MNKELDVSGNLTGGVSPSQQVFRRGSAHCREWGVMSGQEKCPGIEDLGHLQMGWQSAWSQTAAWHLLDLRQVKAQFLHLGNRFDDL